MRIRMAFLAAATALTLQATTACTTTGGGAAEPKAAAKKPAPTASTPQAAKPGAPATPSKPAQAPAVAQKPAAPVPHPAATPAKKPTNEAKAMEAVKGCRSEAEKYCKAVEKDPKQLFACLKQNEAKLAPLCKAEVEAYVKTHK